MISGCQYRTSTPYWYYRNGKVEYIAFSFSSSIPECSSLHMGFIRLSDDDISLDAQLHLTLHFSAVYGVDTDVNSTNLLTFMCL